MFTLCFAHKELFNNPLRAVVTAVIVVMVPAINGIAALIPFYVDGIETGGPALVAAFIPVMFWAVVCDIALLTSYRSEGDVPRVTLSSLRSSLHSNFCLLRHQSWRWWLFVLGCVTMAWLCTVLLVSVFATGIPQGDYGPALLAPAMFPSFFWGLAIGAFVDHKSTKP